MSRPTNSSTVDTSLKAIASLTGPIFLSNLAIIISGTIDTVMAGRLSPADLAGVALGMAIMGWVSVSFSDILQGLSPIAGFHYGAKNYKAVGISLYHSLLLAFALSVPGVFITGAGTLWTQVAGVQGTSALITIDYLFWSAVALPGILLSRGFVCVNASVSRPKMTMLVTVILVLLKIPLNWILMFGVGSFTGFGGVGAGISTAILSWIGLLLYILIWYGDKYYRPMHWTTRPKFQWTEFKQLLKVGLPIGVAGCCEITAFSAMTIFLARLGDVVVAAHQVVANLVYLLYVLPFALGIAGTILVSQSLGAKSPESARNVSYKILILAFISSLILAVGVFLFRDIVVQLYTDEHEVALVAMSIIGLASIYHLVDALQIAGTSLLRGYQITFWPMVIHAFMLIAVALGVGTVLAYTHWVFNPMGLKGYWIGSCVGLGGAMLLIVPLVLRVARLTVRKSEQSH